MVQTRDNANVTAADENDGYRYSHGSDSTFSEPPGSTGNVVFKTDPSGSLPFERHRALSEIFARGFIAGLSVTPGSPAISLIFELLGESLGETGIRQWLVSPNEFLNGRRPLDALRANDIEAVIASAEPLVAGYYA